MKCKECKIKFEKDFAVYQWCYYFCSKKCRQDFQKEKARKEKEKEKIKKQKAKQKKSESITVLKKKLWDTVSLYIRLRDSDDENFCTCCTCWMYKHYKNWMQAWHYIPSGASSFHRYNEKNIHAQCVWCNVMKHGNLIEYRPFMIGKYWQEYTDWLYETRNELVSVWKEEIKQLTDQYTLLLNEIKSKKAID